MKVLVTTWMTMLLCHGAFAWMNWDRRQVCYPQQQIHPASAAELETAVKTATSLRVAGTGHSFSPIVLTNATLITLEKYASVILSTSTTITVQAGTQLFAINAYLESIGRALPNLGAVSVQTAAGATQTGTHGTGNTGCISSGIVGMDLVIANGTTLSLTDGDILDAARVGMGSLGAVSTITFRHVPIWRMEQITFKMSISSFTQNLRGLQQTFERMQWYIYGNVAISQSVTIVVRVTTTRPITNGGCWGGRSYAPTTRPPLRWSRWPSRTTACIDVSYKTLGVVGQNNNGLFTEMELMIPAENDLTVLPELLQVYRSLPHSSNVPLFLGMRYVEADTTWLSPFYGRKTAVVSSIVYHSGTNYNFEIVPLFTAIHKAMTKYNPRPHPGKNHFFTAADLKRVYPRYQDFVDLQLALDPSGKFLNPHMRSLLAPSAI